MQSTARVLCELCLSVVGAVLEWVSALVCVCVNMRVYTYADAGVRLFVGYTTCTACGIEFPMRVCSHSRARSRASFPSALSLENAVNTSGFSKPHSLDRMRQASTCSTHTQCQPAMQRKTILNNQNSAHTNNQQPGHSHAQATTTTHHSRRPLQPVQQPTLHQRTLKCRMNGKWFCVAVKFLPLGGGSGGSSRFISHKYNTSSRPYGALSDRTKHFHE
jgi:hypothetical protein